MKRYEIKWKESGSFRQERYRALPDALARYHHLQDPARDVQGLEVTVVTYRLDKVLMYALLLLVLGIVIALVGNGMRPINSMDALVLAAMAGAYVYTAIQVMRGL